MNVLGSIRSATSQCFDALDAHDANETCAYVVRQDTVCTAGNAAE